MLDSHLTNIINSDTEKNSFSEGAKISFVKPIFEKNEREKVDINLYINLYILTSQCINLFLKDLWKVYSGTI